MDWIEPFYTKRSEWMGPTGIFPSHRARAASIERYSGAGKKRILELGAGAGGTAAAMADLGYSVTAVELSPLVPPLLASLLRNAVRAGYRDICN